MGYGATYIIPYRLKLIFFIASKHIEHFPDFGILMQKAEKDGNMSLVVLNGTSKTKQGTKKSSTVTGLGITQQEGRISDHRNPKVSLA